MNSSDESPAVVELPDDLTFAGALALSDASKLPEWLRAPALGYNMEPVARLVIERVYPHIAARVRAEAVADERQRLARFILNTVDPLLPGPDVRLKCVAVVRTGEPLAAGSVPVATPQPDSRLALLGPARIVLDRCAARENPDDPDGTEAGRMAQRIVDVIGHPVTDQAVVTPADRQRFDSCDETCTVDCGHSRVGMCLVYQVTDRFRWCGLPRGHEDDHDFTYPAAGPVATPTEPVGAGEDKLATDAAWLSDFEREVRARATAARTASPVPAEQPDGWGEGSELADHPVGCKCSPCVIDRLQASNDALRDELRRAADEIDRLRAEQPGER